MTRIIGAKGNIYDIDYFFKKILALSEEFKITIQAVDAELIYGKNHLISASKHAQRAFEQRKNLTNSLAMEILLYASGERQIQKALQKIGVKKGNIPIAFIFMNRFGCETKGEISDEIIEKILATFDLKRDDKVLEGDINTLKKFGVLQQELKTVPEDKYGDVILEKVAMVDIIK